MVKGYTGPVFLLLMSNEDGEGIKGIDFPVTQNSFIKEGNGNRIEFRSNVIWKNESWWRNSGRHVTGSH